MNEKKDGFLNGANGAKSSKRLIGIIMLCVSLIFGAVLGGMAIFYNIKSPDIALSILQYFIMGGCSLLGIGVLEGKKING